MDVFGGFVAFVVIWWTVIFAVMPFSVRAAQNHEQPEGAMPGAPAAPDFKKIILRTTLISAVLWGIVFLLAQFDVISFHRMAEKMSRF